MPTQKQSVATQQLNFKDFKLTAYYVNFSSTYTIVTWILSLNPWGVKLLTKQACRENVVASFVPLKIFLPLCFNVLSTVPRENLLADSIYIHIYIYSRWGVSVPYFDDDKTMLGGLCFFNYFVTPFSTSKFWMKTSKHWAINSSFHTISCDMSGRGKTKTGPGHRQFSLYQSLRYEWSGQNQNKMTWPREDWGYFFFSSLLFVVDML